MHNHHASVASLRRLLAFTGTLFGFPLESPFTFTGIPSVGHNRSKKVPHLRRSHGRPGIAGSSSIDSNPALSGWADVGTAGPPGLGSGWVLFCGSLTQLIKLWHCPRPGSKAVKELISTSLT
jgi:hypothetical protein